MARELTLVDAGLGNLGSVQRALTHVGAVSQITNDPEQIASSSRIVFPGQGAFGDQTNDLINGAIGEALREVIKRGDPFLGICLGMQLLFDRSEEAGGCDGLGVLPGQVRAFPRDMVQEEGNNRRVLKIPHMGWNEVRPTGEHFYFVHSYYVDAEQSSDVLWTSRYGNVDFAAAVRRDNVYGCQFHPEKSQQAGLRFLRSFLIGSR